MTRYPRAWRAPAIPKLLIVAIACTASFFPSDSLGVMPNRDEGVILWMSNEKMVIKGLIGTHEVELLGVCSWCQVGVSVAVRFISLTRAEIVEPESKMPRPPVKVLILKDGREGL